MCCLELDQQLKNHIPWLSQGVCERGVTVLPIATCPLWSHLIMIRLPEIHIQEEDCERKSLVTDML